MPVSDWKSGRGWLHSGATQRHLHTQKLLRWLNWSSVFLSQVLKNVLLGFSCPAHCPQQPLSIWWRWAGGSVGAPALRLLAQAVCRCRL